MGSPNSSNMVPPVRTYSVMMRDRVLVLRDAHRVIRWKLTNGESSPRVCCTHRNAQPLRDSAGNCELKLRSGNDWIEGLRTHGPRQLLNDSRNDHLGGTDDTNRCDRLAEVAQLRKEAHRSELRKVRIRVLQRCTRLLQQLGQVSTIDALRAHLAHAYAVLEAVYPLDQGAVRIRELGEL